MQPSEHEELCKAIRFGFILFLFVINFMFSTLSLKKKGKRHETVEIPETVNADDVRKMLGYEGG